MLLGRCLLPALLLGAHLEAIGGEPANTPRSLAGHVRLELVRAPGAESCPSPQAIEAGVQARLGYDPFQADAKRSVHVLLERVGTSLRAKVELWDAEVLVGEQELNSPTSDCSDLIPALELVIGLAIDQASLGEPEPSPPKEVETVQTFVPATKAPPPAAEKPPDKHREAPHLALTVGVLGAVDAAPSPSFGFTLGIEANWAHLSLGLEGRADLPAGKTFKTASSPPLQGSIRTALIFGTLVPCYHEGLFAGCGLLALGIEQGSGSGYADKQSSTKFYGSVGVRAQADPLSAGIFSLRLHLDLLIPFARTDVQVQNGTYTAWSTPAVSWALGAEGVFRIP